MLHENSSSTGPQPDISLTDVFRTLYEQKFLVILSAAATTAIAVAIALLLPPVYRAESILFPAVSSFGAVQQRGLSQLGGPIGELLGTSRGSDKKTQIALAIVESRSFTNSFIKDNNLMPILFADDWDAGSGKWKGGEAGAPSLWQGVKLFEDEIRQVLNDPATSTVKIAISWGDPEIAASWANAMVSKLNADMRQYEIEKSAKNVDYLKQALASEATVGVRDAISALLEMELRKVMVVQNEKEYAFRVIDPAAVPEEPVSPNKVLIVLLGGILGLGAGGIAALIKGKK